MTMRVEKKVPRTIIYEYVHTHVFGKENKIMNNMHIYILTSMGISKHCVCVCVCVCIEISLHKFMLSS